LECKKNSPYYEAHKNAQATLKTLGSLNPKPDGDFTAINGIPGSGKSRFILDTYNTGAWDLIVTPTSALKQEFVDAGCHAKSWASAMPDAAGLSIIIDEAYLMDPVAVCFYANVSSKLMLVGDSMQQKYDSSNRTATASPGAKASVKL